MEQSEEVMITISWDVKNFEAVFKQYYAPLVNYAFTIVKDRDEAEDVVQQVFVTLWQQRNEIRELTSFRAYGYTAVRNASLNRLKHFSVRMDYAKQKDTSTEKMSENIYFYKELKEKANEALLQLPEQCARVFKMSRFEGLKYQEIADRLNISLKTVENHMGKALKLMRIHLKDYLPIVLFLITNNIE